MTRWISWLIACVSIVLAGCSPAGLESPEYKIAFVPDPARQHGVFALNSDRTGGRLLTPDATAQLRATSWSPDGRKIAFFAARDEDAQTRQLHRMPGHFLLYLMDSAGGNQKRLMDFPVSSFAWSPDSRRIIFVSAYEDPGRNEPDIVKGFKAPMSAVYILDLETGEHKRVTGFGQNCYGSWSPDGARLALSFGDAKNSDIYTANLDGKHTRRIVESGGINIKPVWSPNGKQIAYVSFIPKPSGMISEAYVIDFNGENKKRMGNVNPYEVSWSVDGRYLLLQTATGFVLASTSRDIIVELENRAIQPQDAVFTPDGKDVMFRSNHEGPWYLYVVGLNGANIRRISGNLSASMFCVSPLRQ